jgi:hypothetical protein
MHFFASSLAPARGTSCGCSGSPHRANFCAAPARLDGDMLLCYGSGSLEQDGQLGIVAMKKEEQTGIMHDLGFGKGQCHTDKTSQALS